MMRANSFDFSSSRNSLLDKVPFGCIDLSSSSSSSKKKSTKSTTTSDFITPKTSNDYSSSPAVLITVADQQAGSKKQSTPSLPPRNKSSSSLSGIIDASSFQETARDSTTSPAEQHHQHNLEENPNDETTEQPQHALERFSSIPTTRSGRRVQEEGVVGLVDSPPPLEFLNHGDDLDFDNYTNTMEGESPPSQASTSTADSSSLGAFTGSCNSHYDPSASLSDILQQSHKKKNIFHVSVTFKGVSSSSSSSATTQKKSNQDMKNGNNSTTPTPPVTVSPREDIDTHIQETHLQLAKQQHCEEWAKKQEGPREEFCSSERCQKFAVLSFLGTAVNYHKGRINNPDDEFRLFRLQLLLRRVVEERLRPNWSDPPRCWRIVQELNLFQTKVLDAVDDLLFEL